MTLSGFFPAFQLDADPDPAFHVDADPDPQIATNIRMRVLNSVDCKAWPESGFGIRNTAQQHAGHRWNIYCKKICLPICSAICIKDFFTTKRPGLTYRRPASK
jgi:hypothetical protein